MISLSARINPADTIKLKRELDARLRQIALTTTDNAARQAKDKLRADFAAAGLGRLGFAIGEGSDKRKNRNVKELGGGRWSASGWLFIRSRSQRTVGAIISYTEGATILPRRGRYLWIATDAVKRLAGVPLPSTGGGKGTANVRLEPRLWDRTYGRRLGPLIPIKGDDGTPLLVIKNQTVSASGKAGSLRPRTKTGRIPKGQVEQEITVAFIGIPNTRRAARVDVRAIAQQVANSLPAQLGASFNVSVL
jgi:hypothetical protein